MYKPDRWVVLKLPAGNKVLGGWSGGYLDGDSWRLNSGIKEAHTEDNGLFFFTGHSGSVYKCHRDGYGLNAITAAVYQKLKNKADEKGMICEIMPDDTNWMELDYEWRGSI